jgi:hypothetical protein
LRAAANDDAIIQRVQFVTQSFRYRSPYRHGVSIRIELISISMASFPLSFSLRSLTLLSIKIDFSIMQMRGEMEFLNLRCLRILSLSSSLAIATEGK